MEGVLWVNGRQKRLVEISGHLTRPVKFGGGLLGHLDAAGHFYVKQEEVQPGYWELVVLDVNMKGKALFFKTIGVQGETKRSMFRRVRDDLTAAQGANLLYQQVRSTSKISFKTETAGCALPTRMDLAAEATRRRRHRSGWREHGRRFHSNLRPRPGQFSAGTHPAIVHCTRLRRFTHIPIVVAYFQGWHHSDAHPS